MTNNPTPGSDAAVAQGCTCPTMDNGRGRGHYGDGDKYGFVMSGDCPLHGFNKNDNPHAAGER